MSRLELVACSAVGTALGIGLVFLWLERDRLWAKIKPRDPSIPW